MFLDTQWGSMLWPIRFRENAGIWPGGSYRPAPRPVCLPWWTIQEWPRASTLVAKGMVSRGVMGVAADIWVVFAAIHPCSSPFTVVMHISHWVVQNNLPWQTQPAGIQEQSPRDKQSALARIPPSVKGWSGHRSGLVFDASLSVWHHLLRNVTIIPAKAFSELSSSQLSFHAPFSALLHRYVLPNSMCSDADNTTNQTQQLKDATPQQRRSHSSGGIYWPKGQEATTAAHPISRINEKGIHLNWCRVNIWQQPISRHDKKHSTNWDYEGTAST